MAVYTRHERSKDKNDPYLALSEQFVGAETQVQKELAARYIECVEELLHQSRENCQVSESVLNQSAAVRYENISTYGKKLTFRMFQLLAGDLRELVELLGRNAAKYSEHKRLGEQVVDKFESVEPEYFGSKAFIEKSDHVSKTFREVWLKENKDKPAQSKKDDSSKEKEATSPQKREKEGQNSPSKGPQNSDKKHLLKHGAGYESARKTDRDILNLRESSKEHKPNRPTGIEAELPQRKKKLGTSTITVVSKHNPKADVTQAFRWRPEESLLQTKLNREKAQLDEEYRQVEERIRKREDEERRAREEEARRSGKNRAGSKGRRPKDEFLTTSSEHGNNDAKLDESIGSLRNRGEKKSLSKDSVIEHVADNGEAEIKIEGSGPRQTKSSASAVPANLNKQLEAEEVEESSQESFKTLEFDLKFRHPVKSVCANGKDGLVIGLEFGLVYKVKGLGTSQPVAKPFFNAKTTVLALGLDKAGNCVYYDSSGCLKVYQKLSGDIVTLEEGDHIEERRMLLMGPSRDRFLFRKSNHCLQEYTILHNTPNTRNTPNTSNTPNIPNIPNTLVSSIV